MSSNTLLVTELFLLCLGDVFMIRENSDLNRTSVEDMFQRLIDLRYHPYCGTLSFGRELSSTVTLCPPPAPFKEVRDFETIEAKVSNQLVIKGMLSMSDVASPPVVSRHLILAHNNKNSNSMDSQDNDVLARQPSLCVFLHGAMKAEGLCALVQVGVFEYVFHIKNDKEPDRVSGTCTFTLTSLSYF